MFFKTFLFKACLGCLLIYCVVAGPAIAQKATYTLSGYIMENGSGELLPGVTIYFPALQKGTATNTYGFYSISLPKGNYQAEISSVGFLPQKLILEFDQNKTRDFKLNPQLNQLDEITIVADEQIKESQQLRMSKIKLSARQITELPAFMGESDALKTLQLLPGVQSGIEGSSGLYVRGGGPDQNLLILDDAVVYNASHLFGFVSVFNGDALKNIELYKGGFPARFGGRLSSVVKMDMKEGNKEEFHGKVAVGLLSSSVVLEGPVIKEKASFLITARRSWLDMLIRPFLGSDQAGFSFADLTAKVNYDFGRKNKVYLSSYFGRDNFFLAEKFSSGDMKSGLKWGNATATLRWNHLFNDQLFANTSAIYSSYRMNTYLTENADGKQYDLDYSSKVRDYRLKYDLDYLPNLTHHLRAGISIIAHQFVPDAFVLKDEFHDAFVDKQQVFNTLEGGAYLEDLWKIHPRFQLEAGLRLSYFRHQQRQIVNPEPRLSLAWQVGRDWALKASYTEMNQYIHLLSNTGIGLPTDLWVTATDKIPPQHAKQTAFGIVKDFKDYSFTLETFYKSADNVIEYKNGASFMVIDNPESASKISWEENVTSGKGWTYGAEFFARKKHGRLTGWLGYTLSWNRRQFEELNFGEPFWAKYDRRHDVSLVGIYKWKPNIMLSANWVYGTGQALTLPQAEYFNFAHTTVQNTDGSYANRYSNFSKYYGTRSNFRAEAFHRLDLSIKFQKKKKHGIRSWQISIYNAYSRKNPFYYRLQAEYSRSSPDQVFNATKKTLQKVSLFPILPSVSYNFEF